MSNVTCENLTELIPVGLVTLALASQLAKLGNLEQEIPQTHSYHK